VSGHYIFDECCPCPTCGCFRVDVDSGLCAACTEAEAQVKAFFDALHDRACPRCGGSGRRSPQRPTKACRECGGESPRLHPADAWTLEALATVIPAGWGPTAAAALGGGKR
jgi:ribosomal protein L37E